MDAANYAKMGCIGSFFYHDSLPRKRKANGIGKILYTGLRAFYSIIFIYLLWINSSPSGKYVTPIGKRGLEYRKGSKRHNDIYVRFRINADHLPAV
ncbi:hypothetical protein D3C73_1208660 [compost metagenome]